MGIQISPLFQAVEAQARKYPKLPNVIEGVRICRDAAKKAVEIQYVRGLRQQQRDTLEQNGARHGHLLTGEIHPIEMQACKYLCPALNHPGGMTDKKNWQWILAQPWGEELSGVAIAKTRH